jgi:hypothetical protein
VRNKWYQYVVAAYDDGDAPGGTTCTAGTNCITVNVKNAAGDTIASRNDVRVVVMLSGDELAGQDWSTAATTDYFDEPENIDADETFDKYAGADTFNDLIRTGSSCPADATKLCWSN